MKVAFRSKNEIVYDLLRTAIINGEYKPGTRLVIDQLAVEMGVSQIPIREAMRELEADGFVTIEPYAGATVTEINAKTVFEIFALLESMEIICSRTACRCMSDAELEKLSTLINKMDLSVGDPDRWSQENKELHLFICDCAKSTVAKTMMQKVLAHWDRLRVHYLKDVFGLRIRIAQQEHKQILAAFQTRNPDEVETVISQHNRNALSGYIAHLRSAGYLTSDEEDCL